MQICQSSYNHVSAYFQHCLLFFSLISLKHITQTIIFQTIFSPHPLALHSSHIDKVLI